MLIGKVLRIVLGESRVIGVGVSLQLGGLGAGVNEGQSFILRSNKARLLSAFNICFFASANLLYLTCCDSKRVKKMHRFYSCVSPF